MRLNISSCAQHKKIKLSYHKIKKKLFLLFFSALFSFYREKFGSAHLLKEIKFFNFSFSFNLFSIEPDHVCVYKCGPGESAISQPCDLEIQPTKLQLLWLISMMNLLMVLCCCILAAAEEQKRYL